jgi:hypothetical protein
MRPAAHVYFYRAALADRHTVDGYLKRAYELGRDFSQTVTRAAPTITQAAPS